jgi:hypothetical protein
VIGSDLSAIQPREVAPANCTFEKDDADEPWLYDRAFDYVHLRLTCSCFNDQRGVMKQAFDNLNPGGWVEYSDIFPVAGCMNGTTEGEPRRRAVRYGLLTFAYSGTAIGKWGEYTSRGAMALAGRDILITPYYKQWLIETGCMSFCVFLHTAIHTALMLTPIVVDVEERISYWPINPWPSDPRLKRAGHFVMIDMVEGCRGMLYKLVRAAGLSADETEQYLAELKADFMDVSRHWYWPL